LAFVPVDFERDDLGGALRQAGFRADQPACVSWMGVTMYLTADAVLRTLRTVAGFAAGSCLCFDYRVPATMLNPIERVVSDVLEQQIAALGEAMVATSILRSCRVSCSSWDFGSAESATPDDLNVRYFARRKDGCVRAVVFASCARTSDALSGGTAICPRTASLRRQVESAHDHGWRLSA